MNKDFNLAIKTVRHSNYVDEYEGREGLIKLPYKMLLQQSEIRNGQLQSEIDELNDTVSTLKARIAELETENSDLLKGVLKKYRKEVKREEMYSMLGQTIERMQTTITKLRQDKNELLTTIIRLQNGVNK
ncbi:MAG: hypothetical protein IJ893_00640 [Bacteroidales bacterium]|nr:hypothetical protein [Bacteroidales bacterium]MBR6863250.1 hypothetical protein [Bacteroidales bacterium]